MARTLLELQREMNGLSVLIRLRARELSKFVALKVLTYLVENTPIDTGKAVANWRVSPSGSSYGSEPMEAYFPGQGGSTGQANANAAIEAARAALKGAQPGQALAIINAVPYLKRLNEGWSAQAPAGWVDASILVGKQAVKEYNFTRRLKQDIARGKVTPDG